jgi:enterochelin esterase-like enzyme
VLPQGANGYWANQQGGEAWGDYVARDLVAHVDATYRTLPRREARAVGGLSMGGHGALCLTLTYPDVFGVAGAHTPSLHTEQTSPGLFAGAFARYDPTRLVQGSRIERPPRLWIDAVKNDADAWLPLAERLHDALVRKGWAHEWQVNPGGHNPAYWKGHVRDYLRFYLRAFAAGGAGAAVAGAPGEATGSPGATPGGSVSSAP